MIPLERAAAVMQDFDEAAESADYLTQVSRAALTFAISDAIREAEADMKERCAKVALGVSQRFREHDAEATTAGQGTADSIATLILALD